MTDTYPPLSPFAKLQANWCALAFLLVAVGRAMSRLKKTGGAGAWELAEQLESMAVCAAHNVRKDTLCAYAYAEPETENECRTAAHLTVIYTALLALALFARHMKRQLAGRGTSNRFAVQTGKPGHAKNTGRADDCEPLFLDSS